MRMGRPLASSAPMPEIDRLIVSAAENKEETITPEPIADVLLARRQRPGLFQPYPLTAPPAPAFHDFREAFNGTAHWHRRRVHKGLLAGAFSGDRRGDLRARQIGGGNLVGELLRLMGYPATRLQDLAVQIFHLLLALFAKPSTVIRDGSL